MDKLTMCRICLVEDVKMYSLISANLLELYERLTEMPFVTKDNKPVQVCYLCCARLQNCHRLQATCLKSEEFFTKVMADNELKQMELQDLNTLTTVHPLIVINCVPSTRKDTDDDNIDEENDIKFDPLEIASDFQVKEELFEDDSFIDETDIKPDCIDEDICAENGAMSDNSHIRQDTELEHDIHLKTVKIVLERIDLEQFKRGGFGARKPIVDLPNGNTESTVVSTQLKTEMTVIQSNNIEEKVQTMECPAVVKNKNIVEQNLFIKKRIKKKKHIVLSSLKVYKCVVCEKIFSTKNGLQKHSRIHTGEKPYSCEICEKSFTRKSHLVCHTRIHTGERPYRCNICEQSFTLKHSLVKHIRSIHIGERPHRCNMCGQSFTRKYNLLSHTRIHTGERPYRCNICEQSFTWKSHLVSHTRIHTGERPYRCNICQKRFIRNSHLVRHARTHSGEKAYRCNICEQRFVTKSDLQRHSRIH